MIFQDSTSSLNQKMKVEKILAEPLEIHKVFSDKKEQHDFLCEMMEEVELQEEQLHVWPPELSGGQRQRLSLARALMRDNSIYIFDEATSNIDVESEDDIMAEVHNLAKTKTVILISHRLANVVKADNIYVLKDGRVAESGSHSELTEKNGVYSRLWNTQCELETL